MARTKAQVKTLVMDSREAFDEHIAALRRRRFRKLAPGQFVALREGKAYIVIWCELVAHGGGRPRKAP